MIYVTNQVTVLVLIQNIYITNKIVTHAQQIAKSAKHHTYAAYVIKNIIIPKENAYKLVHKTHMQMEKFVNNVVSFAKNV